MKFTFGPIHPFSRLLYIVGIPLLLVAVVEHFTPLIGLSEVHRLQLFLIASIAIVLASVVNLMLFIYRQIRN